MTGWLIMIGLTLIAGGLLWRFGGLPRAGRELLGAALLLGLAGYAWQGHPGLAGSPTPPKTGHEQPTADFPQSPEGMQAKVGSAADVLNAAQALHDRGLDAYAIATIKAGLNRSPNNADLWVGLGNALVVYADGMMSPAAKLAFDRAAKLSPDHPGPPFFLGLALAQSGQLDRAEQVWQGLLDRAPPGAPWRAEIEQRIAQLRLSRGAMAGQ